MTPEEAEFLSVIVSNPDDDTARLVFADWLEEHGEPERAAYIRLRILGPRAAGLDGDPNEALDVLRDLLPAAIAGFVRAAPEGLGTYFANTGNYSRGLLNSLTIHEPAVSALSPRLGELFAVAPITVVRAVAPPAALVALLCDPACARVRDVYLVCDGNPDPLIGALLDSEHLSDLRSLTLLTSGDVGDVWQADADSAELLRLKFPSASVVCPGLSL